MTNGNDAAHPVVNTKINYDIDLEKNFDCTYSKGGLTKREYFAAMAMQGMLTTANGEYGFCDRRRPVYDADNKAVYDEGGERVYEVIETAEKMYGDAAVRQADALIDALNEESK